MLRRFSSFCCFVLAAVAALSTANADLVLHTTVDNGGTTGASSIDLLPGEEVTLRIWAEHVTPFPSSVGAPNYDTLLLNGGDFRINSNSDSTFHATSILYTPGGAFDGWTASPGEGGPSRFHTGGPLNGVRLGAPEYDASPFGALLPLSRDFSFATIVLRAGNTLGSYTTDLTSIVMLDGGFNDIVTTSVGFSYNVVGVPEPSSALLLGLAATGLVVRRRRS